MDEERSDYYYSLVCLVVDVGTEVLLKVFKKYIPTGYTIETFLNSKSEAVTKLEKKRVLNSKQMGLIKMADETKFDISLLYILIRNLTPIQKPINGWDYAYAEQSDKSPGAFLDTLKTMRNKALAHSPKAALRKSEFEDFWKLAEEALIGLAGEVSLLEKATIQQKIVEAKSKPIFGTENAKLDALIKWDFEDTLSKMASKLDAIKENIEKQDVSKDIGSINLSILEIKDQLKNLGNQGVPDAGPYSQLQTTQIVELLKMNTEDIKTMRQQLTNIEKQIQQQNSFSSGRGGVQTNPTEEKLTPTTNPGALSEVEILENSKARGSDWETFAINLGYSQTQIDALKNTYVRQIENFPRVIIVNWHNVVALCDDENPRKLFAAALSSIGDDVRATQILRDGQLLKGLKQLKPTDATAKAIRKITFATQSTCDSKTIVYNIQVGHNFHPNASVNVGGNMNNQSGYWGAQGLGNGTHQQPIAPLSQQDVHQGGAQGLGNGTHQQPIAPLSQQDVHQGGAQGLGNGTHQQPIAPLSQQDVHQGEGVGDQSDWSISTTPTNEFKKTRDETLPQHVVDILNRCMKSVGYLKNPFATGTAFRVGDRYVITALHVVIKVTQDMYTENKQTEASRNQIPYVYVSFNEYQDHPSPVLYRLNPPCFTDDRLDVAILEIVKPDDFLPCALPLSKTGGPNSKVSIIGYGHPGTTSKHLDPNCPVLAANSDQVVWAINQGLSKIIRLELINPDIVKYSFEGYDDPSRFLLNCFFEHGGSGGPAIDHELPDLSKVVGIYVRGYPSFFFDLPKQIQDNCNGALRFEMCTRTSSLYSELKKYNEELTNNIFR